MAQQQDDPVRPPASPLRWHPLLAFIVPEPMSGEAVAAQLIRAVAPLGLPGIERLGSALFDTTEHLAARQHTDCRTETLAVRVWISSALLPSDKGDERVNRSNWGFFLTEKAIGPHAAVPIAPHADEPTYLLEIYLYQER